MKVACPQCGQHYEIDSNMLDRYYRCTECKTLFWGLKAKSVKKITIKQKDEADGGEQNDVESVKVAAEAQALSEEEVKALTESLDKAENADDSEKKEIVIAAEDTDNTPSVKQTVKDLPVYDERFNDPPQYIKPEPRGASFISWMALSLIVILAVALVGVVLFFNSKIDSLKSLQHNAGGEISNLQSQIRSTELKLETISSELNISRTQFDQLKRALDALAAKVNDSRTASQVAALEEKVATLEGKLAEVQHSVAQLQEDHSAIEREKNNPATSGGKGGRRNR